MVCLTSHGLVYTFIAFKEINKSFRKDVNNKNCFLFIIVLISLYYVIFGRLQNIKIIVIQTLSDRRIKHKEQY